MSHQIHVQIPKTGGRVKRLTVSSLISSKYSLDAPHELTIKLICKNTSIKSSSHETNSFVPQFPEITHKREKPGENHNFDFNLLESVVSTKVSSRPLRSSPE
ncbi:hypothetical protein GQ457_04G020930 [Hibiscus cannabinus]